MNMKRSCRKDTVIDALFAKMDKFVYPTLQVSLIFSATI